MELNRELAEYLLDEITSGSSQAHIARSMAISPSKLCEAIQRWCDKACPADKERFACARTASAEAWLDRGRDALFDAMDKASGIDPSAARAYEQACARMAAIRNPQYSDKAHLLLSNPPGETLRTANLTPAEAAAIYKSTMG